MKFTTLFLATIVGFVLADDNDNHHKQDKHNKKHGNMTAEERTCHRMWKLSNTVSVSTNSTKMDELNRDHPDRALKIKNKAAKAQPELTKLQGNKTLNQFCGVYHAHEQLKHQCSELKHVDTINKNIKNNTALEEAARHKNRTTDQIRQKWQKEVDHVKTLQGNKTLKDQCAKLKDGKDKKGDKGAQKQKNAAGHMQAAGTGAFALSVFAAVLML